ncbi:MAG: hypothetical protein U0840_01835 [Gemmataceae bacterium]
MRRTAMILLLAVLLLAAGFLLGTYQGQPVRNFFSPATPSTDTPTKSVSDSSPVSALGYLQPATGVVSVGGIPGDRIERIFVTPGKPVKAGDRLVQFSSYQERARELEVARKQVLAARLRMSQIDKAETAKMGELTEQKNRAGLTADLKTETDRLQLPALEANFNLANRVLTALESLDPSRAQVSMQDLEKARAELSAARARLESARAAEKTTTRQRVSEERAIDRAIEAARAEFNLNRASVGLELYQEQEKLAELRLERALLKAERSGIILRVLSHEGDTVGQEPILQLADVSEMVVVAKVDVHDIRRLAEGVRPPDSRVRAEVRAGKLLPEPLVGLLTDPRSIETIVARASMTGLSPRADADRRVIDVRVPLNAESAAVAREYIGLEVTVTFRPEKPPAARPASKP